MTEPEIRWSTAQPSQWGRVLSFEVPRTRYAAVREAVSRDLRKRVVRPGFRKGHVPAALVERDFAERIETTTLEKLIPEACDRAIEADRLEVISQPRLQKLDLDDPQVVRFDVALEVRPQIELKPLDGLRGTRWSATVTDEHITRALDDLRDQQAQFVDVDREAQDGDYVLVSYVPLDDSGAEKTEQKVENYPFWLGAGGVVPEFEQAARGRRVGETASASVYYPETASDPEVAGRTVAFRVLVQAVKAKTLPAADDDLARELGVESLAVLRDRIRDDLERRLKDESERDLRESLVAHLLEQNPFDGPQSMTEQFLEAMRQDWEERARRMHMPPPDDAQREEFERSARPAAERMVKRGLLLDALSKQHGIDVTEEDVDKWIEEKVQAGGSGSADVRKFFTDVRRRRRLKSELAEDAVFEFLKGKAQIDEVARAAPAPDAAGS
jgi:trigger factor